jgi:hypothetical protein
LIALSYQTRLHVCLDGLGVTISPINSYKRISLR